MNNDIKIAMFKANLKQYQLAKMLGIHEGSLSKLLNREELDEENKKRILEVIEKEEF